MPSIEYKSYRFRLYPNQQQKKMIHQIFQCTRLVYNHFLSEWNQSLQNTGHGLNHAFFLAELSKMKKNEDFRCINEIDSSILQGAVQQLVEDFAIYNQKHAHYPESYREINPTQKFILYGMSQKNVLDNTHVKLPDLGRVKMKQTQELQGKIRRITVIKEMTEKYYVSFLCEHKPKHEIKTHTDAYIVLLPRESGSLYLSTGVYEKNEWLTDEYLARLKREEEKQKNMYQNCVKQGIPTSEAKNYQKKKQKVAKMYARLSQQRSDYLHKLTSDLVEKYHVIIVPELSSLQVPTKFQAYPENGMVWEEIIQKLTYKTRWKGVNFYCIPLSSEQLLLSPEQQVHILVEEMHRLQALKHKLKKQRRRPTELSE